MRLTCYRFYSSFQSEKVENTEQKGWARWAKSCKTLLSSYRNVEMQLLTWVPPMALTFMWCVTLAILFNFCLQHTQIRFSLTSKLLVMSILTDGMFTGWLYRDIVTRVSSLSCHQPGSSHWQFSVAVFIGNSQWQSSVANRFPWLWSWAGPLQGSCLKIANFKWKGL